MCEKRTALLVRYRCRDERFAKLMSIPLQEAQKLLKNVPVTERHCPEQTLSGYRKADTAHRRIYYRAFSKELGHRLAALPEDQRALLLLRCRDGLSWERACRETGYSESGAMKVMRRFAETAAG